MFPARTLRKEIYVILSDGEWHTVAELMEKTQHLIPPEKAVKYAKGRHYSLRADFVYVGRRERVRRVLRWLEKDGAILLQLAGTTMSRVRVADGYKQTMTVADTVWLILRDGEWHSFMELLDRTKHLLQVDSGFDIEKTQNARKRKLQDSLRLSIFNKTSKWEIEKDAQGNMVRIRVAKEFLQRLNCESAS